MQPLRIAVGDYGLTAPLKDGSVRSERLPLEHIHVEPIIAAMRRMVRGLEFDICEMAFTTYLCAKAAGKPVTAIPVFLTRTFAHRALVRTEKSGIREPRDVEGRSVGVNRGYTVTTGIWARGILHDEYGVDLDRVTWLPTDDEHVSEFVAPKNVDYRLRGKAMPELLLSGDVGAAVGDIKSDSPEIKPLIPDAKNAAFDWFRRTGLYPINHTVVIQDKVLAESPWVAAELFWLFETAKARYLERLASGTGLAAADQGVLEVREVVGDPFPFGIAPNRAALETLIRYAVEQHAIPSPYSVDELFAPQTLIAR